MARPKPRRLIGDRLVIASHNEGKVAEIRDLLVPFEIESVTAAALGLPKPEETGDSFRVNAESKARAAAVATTLPALADDSGLVVPALDGAPGIHSARWAGPTKDFSRAMTRVKAELDRRLAVGKAQGVRAYFSAVLSICWPDGHCESFEGRVDGTLVFPPRGTRGFGYDPIFVPDGCDLTFGEMEPEKKHRISHRGRAFAKLIAACFDGGAGDES